MKDFNLNAVLKYSPKYLGWSECFGRKDLALNTDKREGERFLYTEVKQFLGQHVAWVKVLDSLTLDRCCLKLKLGICACMPQILGREQRSRDHGMATPPGGKFSLSLSVSLEHTCPVAKKLKKSPLYLFLFLVLLYAAPPFLNPKPKDLGKSKLNRIWP